MPNKCAEVQNMKCWICGAEATTTMTPEVMNGIFYGYKSPSKNYRSYCQACADKVSSERKANDILYVRLKKQQMFNTAIEKLESQNIDIYKLKPAIEKVEKHLEDYPDRFDSSYEVMTAIVLINAGVNFQMQKKILRYQVDFYIPSHKIILEIDGERHKTRKAFDNERDRNIKNEIGNDWNIIRIDTDNLEQNAMRLVKALNHVMKYRATGKINWREI